MAASKSKRPPTGATCYEGEAGKPSLVGHKDASGNLWYHWFDTSGNLRTADAATVEAAGFNYDTGGNVVSPVVVTSELLAGSVDKFVFIADRPYKVIAIREIHSVAGGASAAVRPRKITNVSAPGATAGANVIELTTAAIDLTTTVNTVQTPTLSATAADLLLAPGNKIGLDFSGTLTGLVGLIQIVLAPIGS